MLRLVTPLRAGALLVLLMALAVPGVADAAVSQVFTTSSAPVACTVQTGANEGQRFCSASPSRVPSWDNTPIDVSVTLPPEPATGPDGNFPLIGVYHGFGGSKLTPNSAATQRWIARGYAVFSLTARGFGQSCGGPSGSRPSGCDTGYVRWIDNAYEVRDAQYLMGLLADDGVIDPQRIGATGGSYGGGLSYALGALKDRVELVNGTHIPWKSPAGKDMRIAATVPEFGWTDLAYSLVPNGSTLDYVANSPYRGPQGDRRFGIQKQNWFQSLYAGGQLANGFYAPVGSDPRADLTGWSNAANTGGPYDNNPTAQQMVDELTAHHSAYYIDDSEPPAPALLSNGWNDDLFPVDEAVRYYNKVRTKWPRTPISMFHLDWGHSPRAQQVTADVAQLITAENAWFDHYVKGTGPEPADARGGVDIVTSNCATPTGSTKAAGVPYHAANWAKLAPGEIRLDSAAEQTIVAPGTAPSNTFTSGSICAATGSADNASAATYKLDPAPTGGFTIAGSPTVSADMVVTGANDGVYARLYDSDPASGSQRLIGRQLLRPVGVGAGAARQLFQFHPQAWKVAAGRVVKLELLAQDSSYARTASSSAPQQSITVSNLKLQLPVIEQPGDAGGLVQAPAAKVLPPGYVLARDFAPVPDTDGDGDPDDLDADDDGDGVPDADDAFPLDKSESVDTDKDGTGDNADPDDDNDGVADGADACPKVAGAGADGCAAKPGPNDADGDGTPDDRDPEPHNPFVPWAFGATNADDALRGTAGADTICGLLGDDFIRGGAGDDTLFGDLCIPSAKLIGAQARPGGNDRINGGAGDDRIYGDVGNDRLFGKDGRDRIFGGAGDDALSGGRGRDALDGGAGNDRLLGGPDANSYRGGAGNDSVNARNGVRDKVDCGAGKRDYAAVDAIDRVRGCERVKVRRGQ